LTEPSADGSSSTPSPYRGRFAPSPTGPLHLGSLFTALASFLEARAKNGAWLLRIDDIDPQRCSVRARESILSTLERFGLNWDEPVVFQQQRTSRYRQVLERLETDFRVYPCSCSRKDLAGLNQGPVYPGTCRNRPLPRASKADALRLRSSGEVIGFTDALQGPIRQDVEREIGDFVVRRRDGVIAYHLATVIDDADAGITEVLRGFDLLSSTPRQILLQRLLDLPEPGYCHVPVLIDRSGLKLSKQTYATPVDGRKPGEVLLLLLRLLRQNPPDQLSGASVHEILDWAVRHWSIGRLKGLTAVAAENR
jgi:glutamyl-Q tRNA(Asp) synthetase